jgi:hypothetical protein
LEEDLSEGKEGKEEANGSNSAERMLGVDWRCCKVPVVGQLVAEDDWVVTEPLSSTVDPDIGHE